MEFELQNSLQQSNTQCRVVVEKVCIYDQINATSIYICNSSRRFDDLCHTQLMNMTNDVQRCALSNRFLMDINEQLGVNDVPDTFSDE